MQFRGAFHEVAVRLDGHRLILRTSAPPPLMGQEVQVRLDPPEAGVLLAPDAV